jgi:hypothetical protein
MDQNHTPDVDQIWDKPVDVPEKWLQTVDVNVFASQFLQFCKPPAVQNSRSLIQHYHPAQKSKASFPMAPATGVAGRGLQTSKPSKLMDLSSPFSSRLASSTFNVLRHRK